jgi:hypothetical protein
MLAAMDPTIMYELLKYEMAEAQAQARHDRLASECRTPLLRGLRTRLQRRGDRRTAASFAAPPAKQPAS